MTSKTDLANYALAHIGETGIQDIDDNLSQAARVCKGFIDQVIDSTLRSARWNCATARVGLSILSPSPVSGKTAFELPSDLIRLMEVNGEEWGSPEQLLEIEGSTLLLCNNVATIRYIKRIDVWQFDPSLAEAVTLHLASKIVVPLTSNLQAQAQLWQLYQRELATANRIDAQEGGSGNAPAIYRRLSESALVRSRGCGREGLLRWGYYSLPFTTP